MTVLRCHRCHAKLAGVEAVASNLRWPWWPWRDRFTATEDGRTRIRTYRIGLILDDSENEQFILYCGACGRSDIRVSYRRIRGWLTSDPIPRVVSA